MSTEDTSGTPQHEAPFARLLGYRSEQSADGIGIASMTVEDKHRQLAGVVQGGLLVTLADQAFYLAARSVLSPSENAVTVELKTNFIAPAREGKITATARVISKGNRMIVGEMTITDQNQTLIAQGLGTCLVVRQRS